MAIMNFGGTDENVVTRDEFPLAKAKVNYISQPMEELAGEAGLLS